jgi:DNA gyrase subunit A
MIINKSGVVIRLKVADVRIQGRATQGVRLINLTKRNDVISNVCIVPTEEETEEEALTEGQENATPEVEGNVVEQENSETPEVNLFTEVEESEE